MCRPKPRGPTRRLPLVPTPPIPEIDTLVVCCVVHRRVTVPPLLMVEELAEMSPFGQKMMNPAFGSR